MIELRLLGLHGVRGSDGREISALPAQSKRFALLAYLAIGRGDGYHRRDSVAAMFWPDLEQFAARRALRNSLYHLRETLGDGAVITRGDDAIAIDPAVVTSDVAQLRDAVVAERYEDAVDCYRGVLLDGVHFANAGEAFEDWLSGERLEITTLVMSALDALVAREELAGNIPAASRWALRACTLAPDDETWLRRRMSLLECDGDTGGALRMYEKYVQHLAAEFSAAPSPETVALAKRIQDGGGRPFARRAKMAATISLSEPRTPAAPRVRGGPLWIALLGAAALVSALGVRSIRSAHAHINAKPRVLVAVFDNRTGDAGLSSLGRMTQDWITQGVVRNHIADVVDPHAVFVQGRTAAGATVNPVAIARSTGATIVVSGNYYRTGDSLLFQANVADVRSGRVIGSVGPVVAGVRTPVAALDRLGSRVMTAIASTVDVHATQNLTSSELPPFDAYRDYVDAWDAFWHGDGPRAQALFLRSARRDSAFTLASLGAAMVASNTNECSLVDSLTHALDARSQPLTHGDRLSLRIADARCRGRNDEMLRLTLERADLAPGDAGAQMSAAAAALWANRPQRALEMLRRVNPATDLAWSTDTTHLAYWGGIAESFHMLAEHHEELATTDRLPRGAPLDRVYLRGSAFAALSQPAEALALIDSSLSMPVETESNIGLAPFTDGRPDYTMTPGWVANWISRELAVHGDTVAARQAAMRAVAWYRSRPANERSTPEERLVAAWSLEMLGAYPEAERIARGLVAEDSANVDFRGELAGLAVERGETTLADSLDSWLAAQPVARVSWSASVYRARVAALRHRNDDAVARVRDAMDEGAWPRWFHQEPALVSLRERPDFAALMAPKN